MAKATASIEKKFWQSKKWWIGIVGVAVPVVNSVSGWGLSVEEVLQILTPLFAYIVGQGLADFGKNSGQGEGAQEKPVWQSKKFVTSVLSAAIPGVAKALNLDLPPEITYGIVGAAAAYVTGQGFADFGKNSGKTVSA